MTKILTLIVASVVVNNARSDHQLYKLCASHPCGRQYKVDDVLCLDLFSNGSESICRSLWSFRSCVVSKDNNQSEINNYLSCT